MTLPALTPIALVVLLLLAGGLAVACYRLLVDRGRLLLRLEALTPQPSRSPRRGLPAGSYLSDFALPPLAAAPAEASVTLADLADRPRLLIFLHGECLYSRALARELLQGEAPAVDLTAIVLGEPSAETRSLFQALPGVVLHDAHNQVARLYRVEATPAGYLVGEDRRTTGPCLLGPQALLDVTRGLSAADESSPAAATPLPRQPPQEPLPVGAPTPAFTLPTFTGASWSLAAAGPASLTLIFFDPDCPPCLALLPQLARHDPATLVVISRGDAAEHRLLAAQAGLRAPLLLQERREVARAFHLLETPAAYRVAHGVIAAGPAIGAAEVLALLDTP